MKPRQRRLMWVLLGVLLVSTAVILVLRALNSNVMFFYSPSQVQAGEAPRNAAFRLGGLVEDGSLQRSPDGLQVNFIVTDQVQRVPVAYKGLLPDLFKEGKGVVVSGKLEGEGGFRATEVLAKHDENYMPREVADRLKAKGEWRPEGAAPPAPTRGSTAL